MQSNIKGDIVAGRYKGCLKVYYCSVLKNEHRLLTYEHLVFLNYFSMFHCSIAQDVHLSVPAL